VNRVPLRRDGFSVSHATRLALIADTISISIMKVVDNLIVCWIPGMDAGVDTAMFSAAERMIVDGRHELAAAMLRWAQPRFPHSARLQAARKLAYLKLMEKYQEFNPFKFILYAGQIDQAITQINAPTSASEPMPGRGEP
jgi:hypothetical protein